MGTVSHSNPARRGGDHYDPESQSTAAPSCPVCGYAPGYATIGILETSYEANPDHRNEECWTRWIVYADAKQTSPSCPVCRALCTITQEYFTGDANYACVRVDRNFRSFRLEIDNELLKSGPRKAIELKLWLKNASK